MANVLTFEQEDRLFHEALLRFARQSKKEWSVVVKQVARLMCVNLAFQTQPFGGDKGAKLVGEKAVTRDLAKVFADLPATFESLQLKAQAMADAFWKAAKKKDWTEARRILRSSGTMWRNVEISPFDAKYHIANRDRRGRVKRHVPAQIVTDNKKLAEYRRRKVKMVGFAKAGWAAAAESLSGNTRGIPQFVTRHKQRAPGRAVDNSESKNDPHVSLHNDVGYIGVACPPQQIARALQYQRQKFLAHTRKVSQEVARKTLSTVATVS